MKIAEYVPLAIRTEKPLGIQQRMEHSCMGLITEVGEVTTELKRMAIYEKPLDVERKLHIAEEIGDVLWYIAIMLDVLNADLEIDLDKPLLDVPEDTDGKYQATAMIFGEHVGRICNSAQCSIVEGGISSYQQQDVLASVFMILAGLEILAKDCDTTLGGCMAANIAKLRIRYPNAYSNAEAEGRADKAGVDARVS